LGVKFFELGQAVSAAIIPGRKESKEKTGDALYIDTERGILAVADGSEKNPSASSRFLERFKEAVEENDFFYIRQSDAFEEVVVMTNSLVRDTPFHESTTFSAVLIGQNGNAALLHTGDSLVFTVRAETQAMEQKSRTNHLLIGRALHLFQTEIIPLETADMVILATDGIVELARCLRFSPQDLLSRCTTHRSPSEVISNILKFIASVEMSLDDIGIIVAIPGTMKNLYGEDLPRVILKD
jgi:serine/threonine protein phosphatase PrpC